MQWPATKLATIHASAHSPAMHAIRPVRPDDEARLQYFIRKLSPASRYARFMMPIRELPDYMLHRFIHPLPGKEAVWVATAAFGSIVGLGQYARDEIGNGCEVALVVDDACRRQRLGTDLLQAVLDIAGDNGIRHFHSQVLADNYPMRALARKVGCDIRISPEAASLVEISGTINSPSDVCSDGQTTRVVRNLFYSCRYC